MDGGIAQHRDSIATLKPQGNDFAPISSLPPEILCKIFGFLKPSYSYDELGSEQSSSLSWTAVTHVSFYWRRVAINTPSLWVDLPLENVRWVEEMLKRSKDAGLVINANFPSPPKPTARTVASGFKLALKHGSCIIHLSVHNIMHDLSARIVLQMKLPRLATPRLECFSITDDGGDLWDTGWNDDSHVEVIPIVTIPEKFFNETRRLRHLELHKCYFNWNSQPFLPRSLIHLSLHDLTLASKPTGQQFIDALKGMPDLQYLDLTNALPFEDTSWASNHIHLASLQTLIVHSAYREVETFLRCVTFPAAAAVKVECIVDRDPASDLVLSGVVFGLARSYSNAIPGTPFQSLVFGTPQEDAYGVRLRLFRYCLQDSEKIFIHSALSCALELSFVFETDPPEQQITKLMESNIFSGAIPLQDITYIYLECTDDISSKTVADTFGKLPRLRHALVDLYSGPLLLNALIHMVYFEFGSAKPVEKLYFPSLSTIHFDETMFGEPDEAQEATPLSLKLFQNCLIRRAGFGARIEKLIITSCENFKKSDAHSLSQIVDEIVWDWGGSSPGWNDSDDAEEDMNID